MKLLLLLSLFVFSSEAFSEMLVNKTKSSMLPVKSCTLIEGSSYHVIACNDMDCGQFPRGEKAFDCVPVGTCELKSVNIKTGSEPGIFVINSLDDFKSTKGAIGSDDGSLVFIKNNLSIKDLPDGIKSDSKTDSELKNLGIKYEAFAYKKDNSQGNIADLLKQKNLFVGCPPRE